ncbi:hypothetical protein BD410DRAFT_807525 [Rickenella mellea]|uniref:Uncharacterized protein n=1 Tax=Rickenella mellea TaxID=50990 RepID=A0A4Y7PRP8_9AGAM|nr:hypothetical protein BD410DRAFT_807525 [Rickenella mellea]
MSDAIASKISVETSRKENRLCREAVDTSRFKQRDEKLNLMMAVIGKRHNGETLLHPANANWGIDCSTIHEKVAESQTDGSRRDNGQYTRSILRSQATVYSEVEDASLFENEMLRRQEGVALIQAIFDESLEARNLLEWVAAHSKNSKARAHLRTESATGTFKGTFRIRTDQNNSRKKRGGSNLELYEQPIMPRANVDTSDKRRSVMESSLKREDPRKFNLSKFEKICDRGLPWIRIRRSLSPDTPEGSGTSKMLFGTLAESALLVKYAG